MPLKNDSQTQGHIHKAPQIQFSDPRVMFAKLLRNDSQTQGTAP